MKPFRMPVLPPMVRSLLRVASVIVKDEKLPRRGDGPIQLIAKSLSIFDSIQDELGATDKDFARLTEEGFVPLESEALVRFFFESKLREAFSIRKSVLSRRYDRLDATLGKNRIVFLKSEAKTEYEETLYVAPGFDMAALCERAWSMYPYGILLSTREEGWNKRLTFLEANPPKETFHSSEMHNRLLRLEKKCSKGGRSFLFLGPPGTGKTLTIHLLAKKTNRTVLRVDASVLQEISVQDVDFLLKLFRPGILAMDDFDRVPEGRGSARLLLLLERLRHLCPSTVVILSANESTKIDSAALRSERIDEVEDFCFPTAGERADLLMSACPLPEGGMVFQRLVDLTVGLCHSNIAQIVERILDGENPAEVVKTLRRLQELSTKSKAAELKAELIADLPPRG